MSYALPHPLARVPQHVLDAARAVMASGVETKDVDPEVADPLADAVIAAIVPFVPQWLRPGTEPGS